MDPMDWLENHELLRFFRRHKTEMSCMEKPRTFLCQLRDHDLVPEDRYKKVSCMRSKDNMRKGLYEILDWFERERSQKVREFWSCVFKDSILNQYPTLRLLRNSLMDGTRGKSIRTETSWMTPVEFLELALGRKDASWKKDIECEGKPLFVLIKAKTLRIHSLLCNCSLCKPDDEDQVSLFIRQCPHSAPSFIKQHDGRVISDIK
uniref:Uncharacterized protein n=1 Tax=Gasterosteus aculeatus TaxID=69293 RepID=G3P0D4_GASAC